MHIDTSFHFPLKILVHLSTNVHLILTNKMTPLRIVVESRPTFRMSLLSLLNFSGVSLLRTPRTCKPILLLAVISTSLTKFTKETNLKFFFFLIIIYKQYKLFNQTIQSNISSFIKVMSRRHEH